MKTFRIYILQNDLSEHSVRIKSNGFCYVANELLGEFLELSTNIYFVREGTNNRILGEKNHV
jgi:hypothetical protein